MLSGSLVGCDCGVGLYFQLQFDTLAQELLYAAGAAIKKKKKKKKKGIWEGGLEVNLPKVFVVVVENKEIDFFKKSIWKL